MQLCFFEDSGVFHLKPLNLTRPTHDLRVGSLTIQEKWESDLQFKTSYEKVAEHLDKLFNPNTLDSNQSQIWINSRLLPDPKLKELIKNSETDSIFELNNQIVAMHLSYSNSARFKDVNIIDKEKLVLSKLDEGKLINNLWDLLNFNAQEISNDIERLGYKKISSFTHTPVYSTSNPEKIYIGKNAKIETGVILIADDGPILIRDGAKILAGAIIRGPVSIGENATVNMAAKIYGNTSIGTFCKVGGEITDSIFHSYSNKGHDGFLGHSLIGQWVNLGADTNTSNLKNNYSPVKITDFHTGEQINTGQQFFGSVLADHTKTAINTMLNTGTIAGVNCNIIASGFPPSFLKSFSWLGRDKVYDYKFDKALEVMRVMMKRRKIELSEDYIEMMKFIYDNK